MKIATANFMLNPKICHDAPNQGQDELVLLNYRKAVHLKKISEKLSLKFEKIKEVFVITIYHLSLFRIFNVKMEENLTTFLILSIIEQESIIKLKGITRKIRFCKNLEHLTNNFFFGIIDKILKSSIFEQEKHNRVQKNFQKNCHQVL